MPNRLEPLVTHCMVRNVGEDFQIECRFTDGQTLAAISVDGDFPGLAGQIAAFLNTSAVIRSQGERNRG